MAYVQHRVPCCRAIWEQKKSQDQNKPQVYQGFVRLTLDDDSIVELEGSEVLTGSLIEPYCENMISAEIGSKATSIGGGAFENCSGLTSVTISNSVTSIGDCAFRNCRNLISITSLAAIAPTVQTNTFWNVRSNGTLYTPLGSTGYDTWLDTGDHYLGLYGWTKIEQ